MIVAMKEKIDIFNSKIVFSLILYKYADEVNDLLFYTAFRTIERL